MLVDVDLLGAATGRAADDDLEVAVAVDIGGGQAADLATRERHPHPDQATGGAVEIELVERTGVLRVPADRTLEPRDGGIEIGDGNRRPNPFGVGGAPFEPAADPVQGHDVEAAPDDVDGAIGIDVRHRRPAVPADLAKTRQASAIGPRLHRRTDLRARCTGMRQQGKHCEPSSHCTNSAAFLTA